MFLNFQASTAGLGTYLPQIRGSYYSRYQRQREPKKCIVNRRLFSRCKQSQSQCQILKKDCITQRLRRDLWAAQLGVFELKGKWGNISSYRNKDSYSLF